MDFENSADESKALFHLAFAEKEVSKIPGIDEWTPVIDVRNAAVVGIGNMGSGIAISYVNSGIPVWVKDANREKLEKGFSRIRSYYEGSIARGRLTRERADQCLQLLKPAMSYQDFSGVDLVLEAVDENITMKKQLFTELSEACKSDTILASNTSALSIDDIASAAINPSRVVGHHFFAPAHIMQLVEIVRGQHTSAVVIASSLALTTKLKKIGVVVGNCPGFAGNRMYYQYQREAQFLVEEGAQVQEVDAVLRDFGMAMGPFATRDLSGLDVVWHIQKEYQKSLPPTLRKPLAMERLYELGRFGQKTNAGWYRYESGSRTPLPDPGVQKIIEDCAGRAGIVRRRISREEIIERTIYSLINEGAKILHEGIAPRAGDLDIIFVKGYGFPARRGGPMWFADTIGLKAICERVCSLNRDHGAYWAPAPLLRQLAEEGKSFADFDRRVGAHQDREIRRS